MSNDSQEAFTRYYLGEFEARPLPLSIIDDTGREWLFNLDDQGGPVVQDEKGHNKAKQPGIESQFCRAVGLWLSQGRKMTGRRCLYTQPLVSRIVGRLSLTEI